MRQAESTIAPYTIGQGTLPKNCMSSLENQSYKTLHFMRAVWKVSSFLVMQDEEKG